MTTAAFEHEIAAGETLIADVSLMRAPFVWTATVPAGVTLEYDGSISEEPGGWIGPQRNAAMTADAEDYELDPFRFMRFRHTAGTETATVRVCGVGRVAWSLS